MRKKELGEKRMKEEATYGTYEYSDDGGCFSGLLTLIGGAALMFLLLAPMISKNNNEPTREALQIVQKFPDFEKEITVAVSQDKTKENTNTFLIIYKTRSGNLRFTILNQSHPPQIIMLSQEFKQTE